MVESAKSPIRTIDGVNYSDFKIGSDPELRFEGIKARTVVPFEGEFGADGPDSQIGELRPKPHFCPIDHSNYVEAIMKGGFKSYSRLQNRAWLAGSMQEGKALGGHIHFGSNCDEHLDLKLTALDKLLAPVVLMLENEETSKQRRNNTEYGKLASHGGVFKEANRGYKTRHNGSKPLGHPGFEYRPLASWLVSKNVANGVLSLAKVIAFQAHNKSLHRHLWVQLKFVPFTPKFYSSYAACDKKYFAPMIPTIYRIVRSFKLYPQYARYIDYLFQLIQQGRTWEEKLDLKTRWNIIPQVKQTKKASGLIGLEDVWQQDIKVVSKIRKNKIYLSAFEDDEEDNEPQWAGSLGEDDDD